jgi:MerR family glutamine synthetase transcriptional repressor
MKEFNRHKSVYPIGVVQNLTGLSKRQIRYYEETELVIPDRTSGNQRMYSLVDVEKLLRVKKLLERGMNIEEVKSHFAKREEREVETNTLPRLEELAQNSDLRAKFRKEIQTKPQNQPSENNRSRNHHAPPSDRPPEYTSEDIQSLYPVNDRAGLVSSVIERRKKRENDSEEDEKE